MKVDQLTLACSVQSFTDRVGRRTLKLSRVVPDIGPVRMPVKRLNSPLRLKLLTVPEDRFSFEPVIQVRAHAKF